MSEFVDGYEKLAKIYIYRPWVSIFGSARLKREDKYYEMAVEIAKNHRNWFWCNYWRAVNYGIMEAGNKGQKKVVENLLVLI